MVKVFYYQKNLVDIRQFCIVHCLIFEGSIVQRNLLLLFNCIDAFWLKGRENLRAVIVEIYCSPRPFAEEIF